MNKMNLLTLFLILSFLSCAESKGQKANEVKEDSKSVAEIMMEEAERLVDEQEAKKRKLEDLSDEELRELVENPAIEERDLLLEYIAKIDNTPFYFEPFSEEDKIEYERITHYYFKNSDDDIVTSELILYRSRPDGVKEELKRFNRAGFVLEEPEKTPGFLFFYIREQRGRFGQYLWELDASEGIGQLLIEEKGFVSAFHNGDYLLRQITKKVNFEGVEYDFPFVDIYSSENKNIIKEIDLFADISDSLTFDDVAEGMNIRVISEPPNTILELRVLNGVIAKYRLSQDDLSIVRIE